MEGRASEKNGFTCLFWAPDYGAKWEERAGKGHFPSSCGCALSCASAGAYPGRARRVSRPPVLVWTHFPRRETVVLFRGKRVLDRQKSSTAAARVVASDLGDVVCRIGLRRRARRAAKQELSEEALNLEQGLHAFLLVPAATRATRHFILLTPAHELRAA